MKKLIVLLSLILSACSSEKVYLDDNSDRISDLERRMLLNEQLDAIQSQLIQANTDAIQSEYALRDQMDQYLLSLINQETQARFNGDQVNADAIQSSISNQNAVNAAVQSQIDALNQSVTNNASAISNLQYQINNLNTSVDMLELSISTLNSSVSSIDLRLLALESAYTDLQDEISNISQQVQSQQISAYRCNGPGSTERMLKVNGKFYAVMNRVTTEQVQVVTGAVPQTVSTPKLCTNGGDNIKLAGPSGVCPSGHTAVSGTGITVVTSPHSVTNKTVVTSVKIALEAMVDDNYQTTDGAAPCNFSITGNGTNYTNLVEVN